MKNFGIQNAILCTKFHAKSDLGVIMAKDLCAMDTRLRLRRIHLQLGSNLGPLDQQARASPTELLGLLMAKDLRLCFGFSTSLIPDSLNESATASNNSCSLAP